MELSRPYELLDLADGESVMLRPTGIERGEIFITPADRPAGKLIGVLRVHVEPGSKQMVPSYWDVTATTLGTELDRLIGAPDGLRYEYRVTKYGVAPRARFSVDRIAR